MFRCFPWSVLPVLACIMLLAGIPLPAHANWTVLFDQGHGQLFTAEGNRELDLSGLADVFRQSGYQVASTKRALSTELLARTDALVLSGPFAPYTPPEIEAMAAFVKRGGALCVMLHIGPPPAALLQRLGVQHSNGVISEAEGIIDKDPHDFRVTRLTPHPLFRGLDRFSLHGVWALLPDGDRVEAIALTSPAAWVDLNRNGRLDPADASQAFAVAVAGRPGKGRFVVFGDDAVFQNKFLVGENLQLARNLAAWLAPSRPAPRRPNGLRFLLQMPRTDRFPGHLRLIKGGGYFAGSSLYPIGTFPPSAPPGGPTIEEDPRRGQYPDDDGNHVFAERNHVRPVNRYSGIDRSCWGSR